MSAYVIVDVATDKPQEYEAYKKMAQETIAKYGGRYLARGGRMQVLEGSWQPTRLVVLEFPTYERAVEWWNSPEYAPAKALRHELANSHLIVLDGYNPNPHH